MTTVAEQALRAGDLTTALAQLQADIRKSPADPRLRVFLAELLMVMGQWERAVNQLGVIEELDALSLPMTHLYRGAIQMEAVRKAVFAGKRSPLIFGEPASWMAMLVQALSLEAQGEATAAADLRAEAFESAPAVGGTLNDEQFEWVADADARLGPVAEAVINGAYYWVPFERVSKLAVRKPEDLRDLVWAVTDLTWVNGGEAIGLLPARYVGTEESNDDRLRLSRLTEWTETAAGAAIGSGQRMLTTDVAEYGLLDVRKLTFHAPA